MSKSKIIVVIICLLVIIPLAVSTLIEEKKPKGIDELFQDDLSSAGYEFETKYVLDELYDNRYVYLVSDSEDYFVFGQTQLSDISWFSDYIHMFYEDAFNNPYICFKLHKSDDILVVGFVKDNNIKKVECNGKEATFNHFTMPSGREFGFWYSFADKGSENNIKLDYVK